MLRRARLSGTTLVGEVVVDAAVARRRLRPGRRQRRTRRRQVTPQLDFAATPPAKRLVLDVHLNKRAAGEWVGWNGRRVGVKGNTWLELGALCNMEQAVNESLPSVPSSPIIAFCSGDPARVLSALGSSGHVYYGHDIA